MAKTFTLTDEVRDILKRSTITETTLTLPGQLSRPQYEAVMKAIDGAGGKWNRGKQCHVFTRDPREALGLMVDTGQGINHQQTTQQFFTPYALSLRMAQFAYIERRDRILEPSAGHGALVSAVHSITGGAYGEIIAIENEPEAFKNLSLVVSPFPNVRLLKVDFLEMKPDRPPLDDIDVVIMNPPFTGGQDVKHILHAYNFLKKGGRLVAICSPGIGFRTNMGYPMLRSLVQEGSEDNIMEEVPEGAFAESGTKIKTMLIRITKE